MPNEARAVPTPVFDIIIALFQQIERGILTAVPQAPSNPRSTPRRNLYQKSRDLPCSN
jgi:hypothetical protein